METEKKLQILQLTYAGVLADAVLQMGREGILEKVTEQKRNEQMLSGKTKVEQFGITRSEDVFLKLSEVFNCTKWVITTELEGFRAETKACILCGIAKKIGAEKPCLLYCLDPMEGMIKGLNDKLDFIVKETLWEGNKCYIQIN